MKKTMFFRAAALLVFSLVFSGAAWGYTILPTPQQVLFEGKTFAAAEKSVVISSGFKLRDQRILNSLQKVFPAAAVSAKPLPLAKGATVIYSTRKADDVTKKYCAQMQCSGIAPSKIPAQGYFLGIRKTPGGNLVLIISNDDLGEFYATKTLKQLYENGTLPEISIYDWPDFKVRGILEGFYGKPWPNENRNGLIPWMADHKYNIYIYAPKDDYKLRMGWRVSFSEGELKRVINLNKLSKENFVKYCWELSPGLSVSFSNRKDIVSAYKKMKSIIDAGADCLAIAFDDVGLELPPGDRGKFESYWQAQIGFTNELIGKLLEEYPNVMFSFVPNDYWAALCENSEYLRYVGKNLDKRIQVGYTGNEIIPATITTEDVRYYEYYIKRKPILGDNYPVSDYVNNAGRMSLGPLRGRDPRLFRYVSAFVANAMPLPESSKPALLTIADYTWNPFAYDSDESWRKAMDIIGGGPKGGDALLFFAQQSQTSLLWKYDAPELFEATRGLMNAFRKMPHYDFGQYYAESEKIFSRFAGIDAEMKALTNPANEAMLKEMQPWILKLKSYGETGLKTLALLKEKNGGGSVSADAVNALEEEFNNAEKNGAIMTKMVMGNFMLRALAALRDQPEPDLKKYKSIIE